MSYIRFRKHYLHIPYLVLALLEFGVLFGTFSFLAVFLTFGAAGQGGPGNELGAAFLFAFILSCGTLAMGGYLAMVQESLSALFYRTLVAYCLVGGLGLTLVYVVLPQADPGSTNLLWAVLLASAMVILLRLVFLKLVDSEQLVRRVVIFGAGEFAASLLEEYQQHMRALGVRIIGCIPENSNHVVAADTLLTAPYDFYQFCRQNRVSEIVVAQQERRRNEGGWLPVPELMECKLRGIAVTSALDFCERELKKAKLDMVQPSWIVFSEGFKASKVRNFTKRFVDLALSLMLLLVMAPFILLTAIAVFLETGRPILYSQNRVGMLGKEFRIFKFRSMRQDAEKDGKARWASANDARVTRVGAFIRNTRLDELPQIYNVLKGEMSIVGPRPERPEFVSELKEKIPFYDTRHYVKPGLMGWAQLKYPYGASVDDARGKLEYDLYYSKNHSLVMDFLIMIQTVEVVLLGKGVR
ncbi:TIGR03013 family XrtA/PEP-CTERM system glycosyltransferase [Marinobacter lutaoensis]|uniref:UDP-phosphate galactose phosphotransferase n=1 Tax=Marinobacter lutaoensis TaxID=135739 RepID=A0A1V2DYC7_9GAMM|nr:TIGR03013 family XrtA/PEP-CTERM system glycosyltransferase [Marinobacter lutaoensis]NVD36678.1 TIGR03013 family PEP-CTERM/XrtA system glycosyltransferase [Marinobacter lutaoensis]ONF45426.1 UDP-phosphate galactose phosphotransferase [Marinobacter lutaoensis]